MPATFSLQQRDARCGGDEYRETPAGTREYAHAHEADEEHAKDGRLRYDLNRELSRVAW